MKYEKVQSRIIPTKKAFFIFILNCDKVNKINNIDPKYVNIYP